MKFKVKNINLNIYYKYLSLLICDRSSGIFEKLDHLRCKIRFTFTNILQLINSLNFILV